MLQKLLRFAGCCWGLDGDGKEEKRVMVLQFIIEGG